MNRTRLFLLMSLLCCMTSLRAQKQLNYTDFGAFIGTMNYNGDVATGQISGMIKEIRPMGGIHLRRTMASWFTLGTEASYGFIHAKDVNHSNAYRGFIVNTQLIQVNAFMELNFAKFGKYRRSQRSSFYVKAGGGVCFYNPKVQEDVRFSSSWELFPNAYTGFNYFGGAGVKIRTSYQSYLSIETTMHFATFDNLEGYQFFNNKTANDVYGGVRFGYSYMFF